MQHITAIPDDNPHQSAVIFLRRFAQTRAAEEYCDFCAVGLSAKHRHLLEVASRKIVCVCDSCGLRFPSTLDGRFKLIPRDPRALPDFQISAAQWEALALPINLAFFFRNSVAGKTVAMYPSPAGATESLLPLSSWTAIEEKNPVLGTMEADIEALLTNRLTGSNECFITPIDACFELVGLIRMHWRGLSGGEGVWEEIAKFFARLRQQARVTRDLPEANHA